MSLAVNHINGTLKCDNSVDTSLMCWSRAHHGQFFQWVSVYHSLQPRYRFKTWSKSIMDTDHMRGLALHTFTTPLQSRCKYCKNGALVVIGELLWLSANKSEALSREYTSALVHLNRCTWTRLIFFHHEC